MQNETALDTAYSGEELRGHCLAILIEHITSHEIIAPRHLHRWLQILDREGGRKEEGWRRKGRGRGREGEGGRGREGEGESGKGFFTE